MITLLPSSAVRPSGVRPSTHLNNFSAATPGPISFKSLLEPLLIGDRKIVHMLSVRSSLWPPCTYMAKTLKNLLCLNQESFKAESWYTARGLKVYQVDSNDDSRLTIDLSVAILNLHFHTLVWGKWCKIIFWKCIKDRWVKLNL